MRSENGAITYEKTFFFPEPLMLLSYVYSIFNVRIRYGMCCLEKQKTNKQTKQKKTTTTTTKNKHKHKLNKHKPFYFVCLLRGVYVGRVGYVCPQYGILVCAFCAYKDILCAVFGLCD